MTPKVSQSNHRIFPPHFGWCTTGSKLLGAQHIIGSYPTGSMYAIYGNIYHQYTPNVSIYTIHGSYGYWFYLNYPCKPWLADHQSNMSSIPPGPWPRAVLVTWGSGHPKWPCAFPLDIVPTSGVQPLGSLVKRWGISVTMVVKQYVSIWAMVYWLGWVGGPLFQETSMWWMLCVSALVAIVTWLSILLPCDALHLQRWSMKSKRALPPWGPGLTMRVALWPGGLAFRSGFCWGRV